MRAEDLHAAPVITWWNKRVETEAKQPHAATVVRFEPNRFYDVMAGEDERGGGAVLFLRLKQPLRIQNASREYPSAMRFIAEAKREPGAWIDIEKPFWWDVPVWLASGKVDSIGLANNHMCRRQMYEKKPGASPAIVPACRRHWATVTGRRRSTTTFSIAALRIPPSAGSASGVLPNPVGYNRVYVHVGGELSPDAWWAAVKAGRIIRHERATLEGHRR